MLEALGSYAFAASNNADPVLAMLSLGVLVILATFLVAHMTKLET